MRSQLKTLSSVFLLLPLCLSAQIKLAPNTYLYYFNERPLGNYQLSQPEAFLSEKAISRRMRQGIAITPDDVPVYQPYIDTLEALEGVSVRYPLKWINGVVVDVDDSVKMASISKLPFIKKAVQKRLQMRNVLPKAILNKWRMEEVSNNELEHTNALYGASWNQIQMLHLHKLHQGGYQGKGKTIAVFDSGFEGADTLDAFQQILAEGRLLGTHDVVRGGAVDYKQHNHGTLVWSCMSAVLPGTLVGTAPQSNYWLFRTEDVSSEYIIEEYNWIRAAELADSAGVDIINTSLSYTQFDDAEMNHEPDELDGVTTPAAIAANMAASKGMLVVVSAGNYRNNPWQTIGTPADADHALTVGAVDHNGWITSFSSSGFAADGAVKPNVVAQGELTAAWGTNNSIWNVKGTSFSGPIICGAAASLWSAYPNRTNREILYAIERSARRYPQPDSLYGYGIPNFERASNWLTALENGFEPNKWSVFPNPAGRGEAIRLFYSGSEPFEQVEVTIRNSVGTVLAREWLDSQAYQIIASTRQFSGGMYLITINTPTTTSTFKWIKAD